MGSALENGNGPTPDGVGPPRANQVSALIKYVTGASNGEIGEIFGKLTYSAIAKISQSFSERMEQDMELRKRVGSILAEYLGLARILF
jgi:hypothetical protein